MFSQSQESSEWDALYARIREPKAKGYITCSPAQANKIVQWFTRFGIEVEDYAIDAEEYRQYFQTARYSEDFPNYYSFNLPEKSLEHFIAAKLLDLSVDDVYIDIASEGSPVPEIYSKLFGTKTFRQDLSYAPGINGNLIGGDAANMPVPDGFASKMALHCSLEHFEGTSDIGFIKEIARVLRPGGAVCVVPLYLTEKYSIQTDPVISVPSNVTFEEDAIIHCASGWNNRHGRFYDPEHFVNRIYKNLNGLSVKLYRIINAKQIDSSCYVQFAAIIKK
jgi:SAM-dependent methyltransferase